MKNGSQTDSLLTLMDVARPAASIGSAAAIRIWTREVGRHEAGSALARLFDHEVLKSAALLINT